MKKFLLFVGLVFVLGLLCSRQCDNAKKSYDSEVQQKAQSCVISIDGPCQHYCKGPFMYITVDILNKSGGNLVNIKPSGKIYTGSVKYIDKAIGKKFNLAAGETMQLEVRSMCHPNAAVFTFSFFDSTGVELPSCVK